MSEIASWYHCHVEPVRRSSGDSSVGLAAYITGEHLKDERIGQWRDRGHPGEVLAWGSTAPKCAAWMTEPENLQAAWNTVERNEKKINARPCRHVNFALSREFSKEDAEAVCQQIAQKITDRYGVLATFGVHAPPDHGDQRNLHGHVGFSLRNLETGKKVRAPDGSQSQRIAETEWLREVVEVAINQRLEKIGSNERVTRKSYKERGIDKKATVHLGNNCNQLEKQGIRTELGDKNRAIHAHNQSNVIDYQERRLKKLREELPEVEPRSPAQMREDYINMTAVLQVQAEDAQRIKDVSEKYLNEYTLRVKVDLDEEEKRKEEVRRRDAANVDITDARSRYAIAAMEYYDIRRPYSSMAEVAGANGAAAIKEHDDLTKAAAKEEDPDKRNMILMRRDIQHADFMALGYEQCAGISRVITGREDSQIAQRDEQQAQEWRDMATYLREQRANLAERMAQPQQENKVEQGPWGARPAQDEKPALRVMADQEMTDRRQAVFDRYGASEEQKERFEAANQDAERGESLLANEASRGRSAARGM